MRSTYVRWLGLCLVLPVTLISLGCAKMLPSASFGFWNSTRANASPVRGDAASGSAVRESGTTSPEAAPASEQPGDCY